MAENPSTISFADALSNLRALAPLGRSFLQVESMLVKAADLEAQIVNMTERIECAKAEERRALQYVEDAHQAATDADAAAEKIISEAKAKAFEILSGHQEEKPFLVSDIHASTGEIPAIHPRTISGS